MFKNLNVSKSWSQAIASRNIALLTSLVLATGFVMLAIKVTLQKPIVVVAPPNFINEFTIQGDQVSDAYKISWAIYLASTIGNTNQRNIKFNKDVIGSMLSPNLRESISSKMDRAAEILRTRKVKQSFTIEDTRYDPHNDIVYVWGKKVISTIRQEPIVSNWTIEAQVKASNGSPRITYLKQYSGTPKVNELKGKVEKITPSYLSPEIEQAVSGQVNKNTSFEGLGHKPDFSTEQNNPNK